MINIPNIDFSNSKFNKFINEFLSNDLNYQVIGYENSDILKLFLNSFLLDDSFIFIDDIKCKNLINTIKSEKDILLSPEEDLISLLSNIEDGTYRIVNTLKLVIDDNISEEVQNLIKNIKGKNTKIILLKKDTLYYDFYIKNNFDLEVEDNIKNYLKNKIDFDKNKFEKLLINIIYEKIEKSDNKIYSIVSNTHLLNDIENELLSSIKNNKTSIEKTDKKMDKESFKNIELKSEIIENNISLNSSIIISFLTTVLVYIFY